MPSSTTSASAARKRATYLMCGETDPNKRELDPLFERMQEAGNPVRYDNFEGGHVMPPTELMEKAVRWLDDLAPEKKAIQFREALEEAAALAESGENVEAWVGLADLLERLPDVDKQLRKEADSLRKRLERLPDVKPEVKARKAYASALAWLEKNTERVAKSATARAQAVNKFRAVASKHPDTVAGLAADGRADELEAAAE